MANIKIRKYETDGPNYIRAEITWDSQTGLSNAHANYSIPNEGIASLAVVQKELTQTLEIFTNDYNDPQNVDPHCDILRLPIAPAIPLPRHLVGRTLPSLFFNGLPYIILSLDDTKYGYALSIGIKPTGNA